MKLDTNIFICQLPQDIQDYIQEYVWEYLFDEGYNAIEIEKSLENVMCDRLVNVENVLDMDELEDMMK